MASRLLKRIDGSGENVPLYLRCNFEDNLIGSL